MYLTKINIPTESYAYEGNFFVEVQYDDEEISVYLYDVTNIVKMLMFRLPIDDVQSEEYIVNYIELNIRKYIDKYIEKYYNWY